MNTIFSSGPPSVTSRFCALVHSLRHRWLGRSFHEMNENFSPISYGATSSGRSLQIVLSDKERKLIGLLRKFVHDTNTDCTLRIAGGWVRDKLLGLPSDDLDVAIDKMTGVQLATRLQSYIISNQLADHGHTVAVIQTNPDKSKHLETATTKIFGMHIDFVNLRSESYIEGSRIPDKIEFGTPEEDAFRRDISINCLFFNLHTLQVEDFTQHGLADLKSGIIRTPLNPKTTFMDDPLRILRVIRFACRFGYHIVDEIFEVCKSTEIRQSLATKVSKERIGCELVKMLNGNNAHRAIGYFMQLHIADIIFSSPSLDKAQISTINWSYYESTQTYLDKLMQGRNSFLCKSMELAYLGCCLLYYRGELVPISPTKSQKEELVATIVRQSLKLSNAFTFEIRRIFSLLNSFTSYVSRNPCTWNRKETGMLLRDAGPNWDVVALLAFACSDAFSMDDLLDFMSFAKTNNLIGCWDWQPILNGHEIAAVLGRSPGPFLGPIVTELLEWQLDTQPADKELATKFLRCKFSDNL